MHRPFQNALSKPNSKDFPKVQPRSIKRVAPRVARLLLPESKALGIALAALGVGSGINLLFPYLIGAVLNGKIGLQLSSDLPLISLLLLALFIVQASSFYVRHYFFTIAGYRIAVSLRSTLFREMLNQDISFFDTSRTGDLVSRLTADTQLVQRALTTNVSVALRYIVQVIGGVSLMIILSPRLTMVILFLIPLLILTSAYWGRKLRVLSRALQERLGDGTVIAEETLGAMRMVRIFAGERYEVERYDAINQSALDLGEKRTRLAAFFSSFMVFLIHSSIAVIVWYGGSLILRGQLSLGDLTAFLLYCVIVAVSFGFLASVWDEFMQAVGGAERIFEIIDRVPEVTSPAQPQSLPARSAGNVTFDKVWFRYPARPDVPVLKDVSFEIGAGETVALVGPSGSGKSTIASLIPRFYDVTEGSISYCGIPLRSLRLEELRGDISTVAQEPQVFSLSILENIAYGRIGASRDEVVAAAERANLRNFIESLPEGYNTLVGNRGVQLSGGQRQRLAIARAILKNPRFLILDEATSALDSENEALVQQALAQLMKGRTTLVIAHRLSTIQHADRVIVLQSGEICQTGTHQSLMAELGLYKTLVELQLL